MNHDDACPRCGCYNPKKDESCNCALIQEREARILQTWADGLTSRSAWHPEWKAIALARLIAKSARPDQDVFLEWGDGETERVKKRRTNSFFSIPSFGVRA